MLEKILYFDTKLLIFLNNLGSDSFDSLWLIVTKQLNWSPFFIFLGYLIHKKVGFKNLGIILLFIALLLLVCNESVDFCKETVQRLRPCNNPEIMGKIRIVHHSNAFSFFSGHAANSLATMTFLFLVLRKCYKYAFLVFIYPLIFAYSRIYLGVHYPTDIATGYIYGIICGLLFYKGYAYFLTKI